MSSGNPLYECTVFAGWLRMGIGSHGKHYALREKASNVPVQVMLPGFDFSGASQQLLKSDRKRCR